MASETEANIARRQHGQALEKKGVHAIGVEEGHGAGKWVVVAHVEPDKQVSLPSSLSVTSGGKTVDVPLVVRRSKPFALE